MDKFRNSIDTIDNEIISLLKERFYIIEHIKQYKKDHNIPVLDKNRENTIFDKINKNGGDKSDIIKSIYETILNISKNTQKN